ncbi:putative protein SLX4IP [Scophthalmus maximus]|uniref:Protein SLX4IP n=1 Tax=Scophthalmus maximus TaxID=52904 RepID=A0A2U9CCD8_SCOMX|nr:putative protein SLX4IP [Scophthalmus maximus]
MAPRKFVIKCGNFAVLVDLHVLPLGGQEDASWFTTDHIEEVTALVQDAVDLRVKQYTDSLHNRRALKHKKELAPASAFSVKGQADCESGITGQFAHKVSPVAAALPLTLLPST